MLPYFVGKTQVRHTSLLGKSSKQRTAAAPGKSPAAGASKGLDVHHLIHTHIPNALVAHLQEGLEVVHLHTGGSIRSEGLLTTWVLASLSLSLATICLLFARIKP